MVLNKKNYVKLYVSIFVLFVGFIIFLFIKNRLDIEKTNVEEVIRASIYDTNADNHTYYFVLYSDRRWEVDLVDRTSSKGIESDKFINKIIKRKYIKLTKHNYQKIIDQANRIQKPDYEVEVQDGDMMEVYYKGKVYKDTYIFGNPSELHNLMHEFIRISLIPIKFKNTIIY